MLRCPACVTGKLRHQAFSEREGRIVDGVVWCDACKIWYPVEEELLELLTPSLAYREDRARFWKHYSAELISLGLSQITYPGSEDYPLQIKQQTHFDWYASNQTQSYSEYEQMPFWRAVDEMAFATWGPQIRSGAFLLDVGCAQGRSSFKLKDLELNVLGIDISKQLVRQAIARYQKESPRASYTFFVADATHLPFDKETLDYVLIYGVLHHLPNPRETCKEISRVLKHSGVYFGSENNQTIFRPWFDLLQRLHPIWHEEAGPEALLSRRHLVQWFAGTDLKIVTETSIYLPPHLINLMGRQMGARLLKLTNRVGRRLPVLSNNGGLIFVRGQKY